MTGGRKNGGKMVAKGGAGDYKFLLAPLPGWWNW